MEENCSGVVTSKTGRKCFDVTEQRCSLKEEVKTRTIPVEIPIMKCKKAFGKLTLLLVNAIIILYFYSPSRKRM